VIYVCFECQLSDVAMLFAGGGWYGGAFERLLGPDGFSEVLTSSPPMAPVVLVYL
jgi:hypothetical protein